MKVLLIEPPLSPFDVPSGLLGLPEPLALESIAAPMCADHDVTILDMRLEPEALDQTLAAVDPDVVGVGGVTANLHLCKEVLARAKQHDPRILTMIGGHHVSFRPQDASDGFVDVIVRGEGDASAVEVVRAHEQSRPLESISGLVLNRDQGQLTTAEAPLLDMDQLLRPARHLVANYRSSYFQRGIRPIVSINTSRGCPYRCRFCELWKLNRGKYRTRSARLVVDEIETFSEQLVDFIDDNSLEDLRRVDELADLLIDRRIDKMLKMYGRATLVADNGPLIGKLARAGLEMLLVGFESVTSAGLESWNKKTTLEINRRAIEVLKEHGVRIIAYFLVEPSFDEDDFQTLWDYVEELDLSDPVFVITVPFPGTDFYAAERDNITYDDLRLYDFFHTLFTTKLPLEEFYRQFRMLYDRTFAKQGLLDLRDPRAPTLTEKGLNPEFAEMYRRISNLAAHHR